MLGPVARGGEGVGFHDRREADHLEEPRHTRTVPDDELVGERIDLTDDHRLARLDVRKERVENTARALPCCPDQERLLEARKIHDWAVRGVQRCPACAPRACRCRPGGDHVGCGRLEREPAVERRGLDDQRRLSRAPGSPTSSTDRGGSADKAATIVSTAIAREADDRPGRVLDRVDDPPELAEERGVQRARRHWSTWLERRSRRFAGRGENLVGAAAARLKPLEVVRSEPFTGGHAGVEDP